MQYKYALANFFLIQINYQISLCVKLGDYMCVKLGDYKRRNKYGDIIKKEFFKSR